MKARNFWVASSLASLTILAGCSMGPNPPRIVGKTHAPVTPSEVRLYVPECAPAHYHTVATLDASKLGNFSSYQFNMYWVTLLRKQAAALGASAVLLIPHDHAAPYGRVQHGPAFTARAIRGSPVMASASWANSCGLAAVEKLHYRTGQGFLRQDTARGY